MRLRALLRLILATSLVLVQGSTASWAQGPVATETALKAAFIYRFASFVEWPAATFTHPDQPLVIAVSGDDAIAVDLEQHVAGRTIDGHPVVIRRIGENAVPTGAHIVFFSQRRDARLRDAIEATSGAVVIVTEQPNGLRLGSVINFSSIGARVRFSASITTAEARNLKLSARLLAVAQNIEGRSR